MVVRHLKKTLYYLAVSILLASPFAAIIPKSTAALSGGDFNAGRIIDDSIFFDNNRMGATDIQNFLNSKVPNCDTWGTQAYSGTTRAAYSASRGISTPFTCLKDYQENIPGRAADQYCHGSIGAGQKSAAQLIKDVSDACSISPMVLIVLLQKEQALITDDWPWPTQYQKATGFGCPDTAACDTSYSGFFNQVYQAARQYQVYAVRPGLFNYQAGRGNYIYFNPNFGCGGSSISIANQATAGLYNYTPYQPNTAALNNLYGTGDGCSSYGNRNFWRMYNDWFGSPITSVCSFEKGAPLITDVTMRKLQPYTSSGDLVIYSGSSTNCIESHTWSNSYSSWADHTASNQVSVSPANCALKFADVSGDGIDEPILVCYRNTGSGMVEFHVWNYSMHTWIVHAISNLPCIDPSKITIEFANFGGGKDEPVAIGYSGTTTGMVEVHIWNNGLQTWRDHIVTNLPIIDPNNMNLSFADLNGDGQDEGIAIGVNNTSTGKIEFHVWAPGFKSWRSHYASNQDLVNMSTHSILFGNTTARGPDHGVLVSRQNTGSGRIEFHVWDSAFATWQSHNATNQPTL